MSHVYNDWAVREYGAGWPSCAAPKVSVKIFGRTCTVAKGSQRGFRRIDRVYRQKAPDYYRHICQRPDTGTLACRPIGGTSTPSQHSFGLAIDLAWQENPQGRLDVPLVRRKGCQDAAAQLEAEGFDWGRRYPNPDPMHWGIGIGMTKKELRRRYTRTGKLKRGYRKELARRAA